MDDGSNNNTVAINASDFAFVKLFQMESKARIRMGDKSPIKPMACHLTWVTLGYGMHIL